MLKRGEPYDGFEIIPRPAWATHGGTCRCLKCGRRYLWATRPGTLCPSCTKIIEAKQKIDKESAELMKRFPRFFQ